MLTLGIDIGSSSIKISAYSTSTGETIASTQSPDEEMEMLTPQSGWAEQHPETWITHITVCLQKIKKSIDLAQISAIGIAYQMHGLVLIDQSGKVLRPAIIWCDSRAVSIGNKASTNLKSSYCQENLLNSPGNFTASKLKWVQQNEKEIYSKIYKIMLPGDYIVYRLTNKITTTISGLSEAILWDFKKEEIAYDLLKYYDINPKLLPDLVSTFSVQGEVTVDAAKEFGLPKGIPISYRAGDQPNNAFSLNVLHPGEVAATAGTSGVVYAVSKYNKADSQSRINTFLHVNHTKTSTALGVLLCINATGIANAWIRKNIAKHLSYEDINNETIKAPIGSDNLLFYPFGNGAERMLCNLETGASFENLNFNIHHQAHLLRSVHEGIAFSFAYGISIMNQNGIATKTIKAGNTNMFLSPVFRETLAAITGTTIQLYNTDGATGAARGAAVGAKIYTDFEEAFIGLKQLKEIKITKDEQKQYQKAYENWRSGL